MDQLNMFQQMYNKLPKWNGTLKLGTFFSGIGAPEGALKDIGIDVDLQFFSEIDKYAIQAYCEIHNVDESLGVGSISDLKGIDLPYCDMWFGGFPCQDISLAGNGKGFDIESGSRSSLGWEMIRLASEVKTKPKYIIFENVAAIFNNTHRPILNLFKRDLEELGYTLYNKLLNAKHFGSPQNRNRYFLVAILGEYNYNFPKPIKLELRLKDLLEDDVDEKYYLSDKMLSFFEKNSKEQKAKGNGFEFKPQDGSDVAKAVTTRAGSRMDDNFIKTAGKIEKKGLHESCKRVLDIDGISTTVTTVTGGGHEPKILIPEATKKGYAEAHNGDGIYLDRPHQKRGVVQKGMTPTIKCSGEDIGVVDDMRIRKLTPKECYRLQAFSDEDYDKAASVISNAQLYKTAGNSINRNVLKAIFTNLLKGE